MSLLDMFGGYMQPMEKNEKTPETAAENVAAEVLGQEQPVDVSKTAASGADTAPSESNASAAEDDFSLEEYQAPAAKKSKSAKPEKKNVPKKSRSSNVKDYEVALPVTVYATGFKTVLEGHGNIKVSEIAKRVFELGYKEVALKDMQLVQVAEGSSNVVLTMPGHVSGTNKENSVFSEAVQKVNVGVGGRRMELTESDFDGMDADEISVGDVLDRYAKEYPAYKNASIIIEGSVGYPFFGTALSEKDEIEVPVDVFVGGEAVTVENEKLKTVKDLAGHFSIGKTVAAAICKNADGVYVVNYKPAGSVVTYKKDIPETGSAPKNKAAERWRLPLRVFIGTWGQEVNLSPSDFGGKEKIDEKDIKDYFAPRYPVFADDKRKMDLFYIKEENTLSIMFVSGEKGADASSQTKTTVVDTAALRFSFEKDDDERMAALVQADLILPKIPREILDQVIDLFRSDLQKECYVKVVFNGTSYEVIKPEQQVSKVSVDYTFDPAEIRGKVQVMDIHSHNTMDAFFSGTDDRDECYPGLFGVIGKLDKDTISMMFRAGYNGQFVPVLSRDIFEEGA